MSLSRKKIPKPGPARFSILCVSAVGQGTKVGAVGGFSGDMRSVEPGNLPRTQC